MTLLDIATSVDLDLDVPTPVADNWLAELSRLGTVEKMREGFFERYPQLDAGRLKQMAIVGASGEGARLTALCRQYGIEVVALCDDNPNKIGTQVAGQEVSPTQSLTQLDRGIPVIIASHRPLHSVQRLRGMGFSTVALFLALEVMDPGRFTPHMFYDGWLEDLANNREQYHKLQDLLADDESRRHLDAILGFRLTGDLGALAPVVDWDVYEPKGLITWSKDEVYIDCGTFDGDTIQLFMNRVNDTFSRVIGFEPDPETYPLLKARFANDARVEAVNKGVFDRTTTLRFDNDASRGSILRDEGGTEVQVTSIDEYLAGDRATFIKMNIEGAERAALQGASKTISKWYPRLGVSCYHFPHDLWGIPFFIKQLGPEYRIYLRQQDAGVIETVTYGLRQE